MKSLTFSMTGISGMVNDFSVEKLQIQSPDLRQILKKRKMSIPHSSGMPVDYQKKEGNILEIREKLYFCSPILNLF
ncbi:MAG: hypothetical protein U0073_01220 [Bacteroidia bacterium]